MVGGENGDEEQVRASQSKSEQLQHPVNVSIKTPAFPAQDWEDEGATLARQFSTVLVFDAEEGVWRPTDASWRVS